MLKNILILFDTIIDNYILAVENPKVDGETKKVAFVAANVVILDTLAVQFKVGGLVIGIAKLLAPFCPRRWYNY